MQQTFMSGRHRQWGTRVVREVGRHGCKSGGKNRHGNLNRENRTSGTEVTLSLGVEERKVSVETVKETGIQKEYQGGGKMGRGRPISRMTLTGQKTQREKTGGGQKRYSGGSR